MEGDGTGIQSFVHTHNGDTGLLFSGHDRALNRSGAAVGRQQRSVDVPGTKRCCVEGVGAQDLAVGRDHEGVVGRDLPCNLTDTGRLTQREVCVQREFGDGGFEEFTPASLRAVGLGDHEPDLVIRGDQAAQDGSGEGRGSSEC